MKQIQYIFSALIMGVILSWPCFGENDRKNVALDVSSGATEGRLSVTVAQREIDRKTVDVGLLSDVSREEMERAIDGLIRQGADINVKYVKPVLVPRKRFRFLGFIFGFNKMQIRVQTALSNAVRIGNTTMVEVLLSRGAYPDFLISDYVRPVSTVVEAVENSDYVTTKLLLNAGARPNPWGLNEETSSPLSTALKQGDYELVTLLLERGADPNETNDGKQVRNKKTSLSSRVATFTNNCRSAVLRLLP